MRSYQNFKKIILNIFLEIFKYFDENSEKIINIFIIVANKF